VVAGRHTASGLAAFLSALLALSGLVRPAVAQPAPSAQPQGGRVVAGAASIAQTRDATRITQTSPRAALDWRSFDVGRDQTVAFSQPSASAVALNRVTGPDPSQIAGRITANGQVVLMNQSGVVFLQGSQVDAQSVVASAASMTDASVKAFAGGAGGMLRFDAPARPGAAVTNQGTMTVGQAGLAALVAPRVANTGVIRGRMGHAILAGAEMHTLDLYGDGLMSIDVTGQVRTAPAGPDGKPVTALVTNSGIIEADGGTVLLTAAAADGVVQNLVTAGGRISANSRGGKQGTIAVRGVGGALVVDGALDAKGIVAGSRGGQIEIAGTGDVTLAPTARVNASGQAGGGTVAIGTTLARASGGATVKPTTTARRTTIAAGANVAASAMDAGDGGTVVVLSTASTEDHGAIATRGGVGGGNGGNVEISGHGRFQLDGLVDTAAAPRGRAGTLLVDPDNLEILAPGQGSSADSNDFMFNSVINAGSGPVNLSADKITVSAPIDLGTSGGRPLTMTASNAVIINASITTNSGIAFRVGPGGVLIDADIFASPSPIGIASFNGTGPSGPVSQSIGTSITASRFTARAESVNLLSPTNQIGSVLFTTATGDGALASSIPLLLNADSFITVPAGKTITLAVDSFDRATTLAIGLRAPSGQIILAPATPGRAMEVTNTTAVGGTLSLQDGVLQQLITNDKLNGLALGSVTGGNLTIRTAFDFSSLPDGLQLISGQAISVRAPLRSTTPGSRLALLAGTGGITLGQSGALIASNIDLSTTGNGISQDPASSIATAVGGIGVALSSSQGVVGPVALSNAANNIGTLGPFQVTQGNLSLNIAVPLAVIGPVSADNVSISAAGALQIGDGSAVVANGANGTVTLSSGVGGTNNFGVIRGPNVVLNSAGSIQSSVPASGVSPSIIADTLTGNAGTFADLHTGNNQINRLGAFTTHSTGAPQALSVTTGGALDLAGAIDSTGGKVVIGAGGNLTESTGSITASTLSAQSNSGDVLLTGPNAVATLDAVQSQRGRLSFTNTQGLVLAPSIPGIGVLGATGLTLTVNGNLAIGALGAPATLSSNGTVALNVAGTITSPNGSLAAGTLTGSALHLADFGPAARIADLGNFSVTGSRFVLTNAIPLTISGLLSAGSIQISAPGQITLAGSILTDGLLPAGSSTITVLPGILARPAPAGRSHSVTFSRQPSI
jgi:filamentous hemagglutinin family protein